MAHYFTAKDPSNGAIKTRKSREDYGYKYAVWWTFYSGTEYEQRNVAFTTRRDLAEKRYNECGGPRSSAVIVEVAYSQTKPKK